MIDAPSPVRARSITPEELSEANARINALTRKLEECKRIALDACDLIQQATDDIELPPDIDLEILEVTAQDLDHSLRASERARIKRGEFEPGDVEKIRKFLWLTEIEWEQALGMTPSAIELVLCEGKHLMGSMRRLLLLAIREPSAFRRALVET